MTSTRPKVYPLPMRLLLWGTGTALVVSLLALAFVSEMAADLVAPVLLLATFSVAYLAVRRSRR